MKTYSLPTQRVLTATHIHEIIRNQIRRSGIHGGAVWISEHVMERIDNIGCLGVTEASRRLYDDLADSGCR